MRFEFYDLGDPGLWSMINKDRDLHRDSAMS